jgi:lipopolysaccharide/colanic/teichoic acid biosynthesis glycosyltransferase
LPLKSLIDFVLGLILLVLLSPVILAAAALVKLTSKGPAFYLQTRVGKDGRPFKIIKLRSMRPDAEAGRGAVWATVDDDRVTPVGRILRSTHIDEFPQLINVVMGDMSLVGPRPERPEFVRTFELQIDHYSSRLRVRPGITGIAQLRLPPDTDLNSVREKLEFDLYYVRHVSPWLDLLTLVGTGWQLVASILDCLVPSWMRIPTQEAVRRDLALPVHAAPAHSSMHPSPEHPVRAEKPLADTASSGAFSVT